MVLPLRAVRVLLPALVVLSSGLHAGDDPTSKPIQVAELTLSSNAAEDPVPPNPLGPTRRNFLGRLEQIRAIAADPDVAGVRLELKGAPSFAHTLDLLAELQALKDAGKKIVCYTEMLGRNEAVLASVSDLLVVPPSGMIVLEGLTAEMMYMKDMFDKLDVRFEVLHIGEYKTAYENLSREGMSAGQREVISELLDEFYDQIVDSLVRNRGMSSEAVEGLFSQLLVEPEDAARAGFIDAVAYEDGFDAQVERLFGGEVELIENYGGQTAEDIEALLKSPFAMFKILEMLSPPERKAPSEPYVAIVYATGVIESGKSKSDLQGKVSSMGSETIVEALQEAGEDDNCKAVVLRVNSPGGSALASDMIWRAIQEVRESKPVVSSMGSVAASGGYWISMGCDAIVAQPSTITGSIGVVSMLPDVSLAVKDLGINVEVVSKGPLGDQLSLLKHGPTPVLRETLTRYMEVTYDMFLDKVSVGRRLGRDRVAELAHGRVWTGRQAEDVGLVDELGGLGDSIELACALGGVSTSVPVVELPEAPDMFKAIEQAMEDMVTVRSPAERLIRELGFGALLDSVRESLSARPLHPERVQALLPFQVLIR